MEHIFKALGSFINDRCHTFNCIPNFLPNFRVGFRDGTNIRETERVRKKLEKLVPTLIFGKTLLPKIPKPKISAKRLENTRNFRNSVKSSVKSSEKARKTRSDPNFRVFVVKNGHFWSNLDSKLPNFLPNFFRENYRLSVKARLFVSKITEFR